MVVFISSTYRRVGPCESQAQGVYSDGLGTKNNTGIFLTESEIILRYLKRLTCTQGHGAGKPLDLFRVAACVANHPRKCKSRASESAISLQK